MTGGNNNDDFVACCCSDARSCEARAAAACEDAAAWLPQSACAGSHDDSRASPRPPPPPPPPPPLPPRFSAEAPLTPGRAREATRAHHCGSARGVHVPEVPGLRVLLDVVSEEEERDAMSALALDRGAPASNIHVATQWGWRFYTWNRTPPMVEADRLAPLPRWMRDVVASVEASDPQRRFLPSFADWGSGVQHALLNEYHPGDGVAAHTDDLFFWTSWVRTAV
jgi:hypothetical protein